jgi:hypothetical protein
LQNHLSLESQPSSRYEWGNLLCMLC